MLLLVSLLAGVGETRKTLGPSPQPGQICAIREAVALPCTERTADLQFSLVYFLGSSLSLTLSSPPEKSFGEISHNLQNGDLASNTPRLLL